MIRKWQAYKTTAKEKSWLRYQLLDWTETILICGIIVLFLRKYIVQTSLVYSGSMHPTMQIRDRLFVNKMAYYFRDPKRGEIVLFNSPYKDGRQFVKRLIGLPGERISVQKGEVYINGKLLLLPGVHVVPDYSYMDEVIVPENTYFVLGDNRGNSADSRVWGFVPRSEFLGKAIFTFWPIPHMQLLK